MTRTVVLSGFFFGGLPGRVLEAWRDDRFTLVLSTPVLAEYREAGAEFEGRYGGADFEAFAATPSRQLRSCRGA